MHSETNLNDLIFVATVTQSGSLSAAARQLGVNHATVFRRIVQLEKNLGVRLFDRTSGRYVPTPAGEELAAAGAAMQATAEQSLLKVAGRDLRPSGPVRITTTDSVAKVLLNRAIARCRARFPHITLHVIIDNAMFNLSKRDADIAVRASAKPPDHLIGKRIASVGFAIYVAKSYVKRSPSTELADHDWIALGESQERHITVQWLAKIKPLAEVAYRMDGFAAICQACSDGLGLALLPCFLGDSTPALRRMTSPDPPVGSELWLLVHPDLRDTARVKVVYQLLNEELALQASQISGLA